MIACFDVHYGDDTAWAAAVVLRQWDDSTAADQVSHSETEFGDYRPGSFYQRELKPLQVLVARIHHPIQYFVIDAYCHLSAERSPGLGAYLHRLLPVGSVVIGVAKNRFRLSTHAVELFRGNSDRPLFVTSIGMDYESAAKHIESMAGAHRIPSMLKMADRLARSQVT
ncbi:MAG: endonuclease V [Pirellulaceae bacterium]|nr:endonuclease V [Pirellulaceae bacterium]